ncbi:zinc finger and BTB domain-containing protein 17 isoform X5 [Solenopsis invicta]|uniref:zinc finger and BTB domain-containing protein 17 isoform X5 n=1 Tax=Solenopsis invicta TaxID=13686 RepID=UPI00193CC5E6|nr:zinc finger and BTB domain-containing protein 17 isoform X5 [Solenopsis invicta]
MEDDQQFCLRWNNHQSTLIQNFDTLLESGTLVDCTLAAEGKTLKAHKVVLSACSPYFECLLSEHYDKHPVFILKDVKFKELKAMMDYMYRGEVNISQDQLAALLKAAESLQIKGLSESKTAGSSKTESRPQKTVSQPTAPSLDIPHASSGLTIEKNKVPRQSLAPSSVGDIPEDSASPQVSKGLSSREGSQSPTSRKRKRPRRRSLTEETIENQDASNSSDMPQQMGVPALGIAPVADEKVHADPTDSLGRSALMTQLTKPADEMLQLPLEKPEPNDNLIEPKSEYLDDAEEGVEDLTLDEDMNDLNDMEQDNNRAGPSHDPAQHPAGLGSWHVTGDRSNAGGVVGSVVAGAPGTTDEVFLQAQEAAQAHRDSQDILKPCSVRLFPLSLEDCRRPQDCIHLESALPKRHFCLNDCGRSFESIDFMMRHLRECYNETQKCRNYLCHKCGHLFMHKIGLREHLSLVCDIPAKFTCPYCSYRGRYRFHVTSHILEKHSCENINVNDVRGVRNKPSMYFCRYCDYKSEQPLSVRIHTKHHHPSMRVCVCMKRQKAKSFSCGNCSSVFIFKSTLRHHQKFMCDQPPRFKCPYCVYRTKYQSNVRRHIGSKHPGQIIDVVDLRMIDLSNVPLNSSQPPRYKCPYCVFGTKYSMNMRVHIRRKHPGQSINVVDIRKIDVSKVSLNPSLPPRYKCPYCVFGTKYSMNMRVHIRRKHPGQSINVVDMRKIDVSKASLNPSQP